MVWEDFGQSSLPGKFIYLNIRHFRLSFMRLLLLIVILTIVGCKADTAPPEKIEISLKDNVPAGSGTPLVLKDTTLFLKAGETEIKVKFYNFGSISRKVFINLHDDENTSVDATKKLISETGDPFLEVQAQGERMISFRINKTKYRFDPNRIFAPAGIEKTLKANGKTSPDAIEAVARFAESITNLLAKYDTIVAVHNNKRGYSLKDYLKGGSLVRDAEEVFQNSKMSPHDFFFVVDRSDFEFIKGKKINVVLQSAATVTDDGSLSVYCQQKGIRYLNCEALEGNLKEQTRMLREVFK